MRAVFWLLREGYSDISTRLLVTMTSARAVLCDLIGPGAPLDATTASVIGLPRAGPRGSPWRFVRAALPHSLASELTSSTDRTTLGSYVKNISAILDQRKKASLERQPVPPRT